MSNHECVSCPGEDRAPYGAEAGGDDTICYEACSFELPDHGTWTTTHPNCAPPAGRLPAVHAACTDGQPPPSQPPPRGPRA